MSTRLRAALGLQGSHLRPPAVARTRRKDRLPTRRRQGDLIRIGIGLLVLFAASIAAHLGQPTVVEVNLFRLINELPTPAGAPLLGIMQLGALGAVPVIAVLLFLSGRPRPAVVAVLAGGGAWGVAKLIQYLVDEEPPAVRLPHVVLHGGSHPGLAFPASHVAIAAALTTALGPYLGRTGRRGAWLVTSLIAVARVYVGLHLPIDVVGGLTLGWLIGAAVTFALGAPARRPADTQLVSLLHDLGLAPLDQLPVPLSGGRQCCWLTDGRRVLVTIYDREGPDQDWLYRMWRLAAFRDPGSDRAPAGPARADREAHLALLAERAGVRTPALIGTRRLSDQASLVVRDWVDATPLASATQAVLTEAALHDAWTQLDRIHTAGIEHRSLRPDHVLVDASGHVWITGWHTSEAGTEENERAADVADLSVAIASRVGPSRTIGSAVDVLGADRVIAALPHLQPLALAAPVRAVVASRPGDLLADLRAEIADMHETEAPAPISPLRVAASNLAPVVAIAIAVYALLPRLADTTSGLARLSAGRVPWIAAMAGASMVTYVMAAFAVAIAAGPPIAVGRTVAVQLAAACANRVTPAGLGAAATNIRYLELSGFGRADAVGVVAMTATSGFIVHTVGVVGLGLAVGHSGLTLQVPSIDPEWPVVVVGAIVIAALGWVVWLRRLHHPVVGWLREGSRALRSLATQPGRAGALLLASAGITLGYTAALGFGLNAFGIHLGFGPTAVVYLGASAVGAAAPTPGGTGPFEAALVTGLSAYGVAAGPAVAAVIVYRLVTFWLPVAPGAVALHRLRRAGAL